MRRDFIAQGTLPSALWWPKWACVCVCVCTRACTHVYVCAQSFPTHCDPYTRKEIQKRGETCIHITESLCWTAETASIVKQLYFNKTLKKNKRFWSESLSVSCIKELWFCKYHKQHMGWVYLQWCWLSLNKNKIPGGNKNRMMVDHASGIGICVSRVLIIRLGL